jgi:hypothetical protein
MVVVALDRPDLATPLIDELLPLRDQLAGFSSTSFALCPVATTLGELFRLRGQEAQARRHFVLGAQVARIWGSLHWLVDAKFALQVTAVPLHR